MALLDAMPTSQKCFPGISIQNVGEKETGKKVKLHSLRPAS
jgi:hypothetical protein